MKTQLVVDKSTRRILRLAPDQRGHQRHHEPDLMAALQVNDENLPVEVQQHIEGRVAWLCQGVELLD